MLITGTVTTDPQHRTVKRRDGTTIEVIDYTILDEDGDIVRASVWEPKPSDPRAALTKGTTARIKANGISTYKGIVQARIVSVE